MNACTHHSGLLSYMLPEEWLVCSTTSRQKKKGCPIRNGMGAENQCLHCHESQRCILRLVHKELRRDTLMPYNYRDYLHSQPIHTTYTPSNHHTWVGETKKSLTLPMETDFTNQEKILLTVYFIDLYHISIWHFVFPTPICWLESHNH